MASQSSFLSEKNCWPAWRQWINSRTPQQIILSACGEHHHDRSHTGLHGCGMVYGTFIPTTTPSIDFLSLPISSVASCTHRHVRRTPVWRDVREWPDYLTSGSPHVAYPTAEVLQSHNQDAGRSHGTPSVHVDNSHLSVTRPDYVNNS